MCIHIDLWQEIAKRLTITDFKYIPLDANYNQHIIELSHGKYDLIISPMFINSERYNLVDFVETIAVSPTVILLKKDTLSIISALRFFLSGTFIYCLLGYLAAFLIYTHLLWFFERGKTLPKSYSAFADRVIWMQLLYGKLDKLPQRWEARTLGLVWKVVGYALLSLVLSLSTVTVLGLTTHLFNNVTTIDELRKKRIAGEAGSLEYENIKRHGLHPLSIHNINEGLQLIRENKLDGIAINKGEAEYFLNHKHLNDEFYVTPVILGDNLVSFPLKRNSPLLRKINTTLLDLQAEGYTTYICSRYLSLEGTLCIGN